MLKKIISGGQTGADQAALDAAIELGFPYSGWVPMGRNTETGPLPAKYHQMLEMPTACYPACAKQNVMESDGTLILSHGPLTGGSALTEELAKRHNKPCKHMDLEEFRPLMAPHLVIAWIDKEKIEVLNVTGSSASKDPGIYMEAKKIIASLIKLSKFGEETLSLSNSELPIPSSVGEAVAALASVLSLRGRVQIAALDEQDLVYLLPSMEAYVKNKFLMWGSNKDLMRSCAKLLRAENLNEDAACIVILEALWRHLKASHKMRVVT